MSFFARRWQFETPLTPHECTERLNHALEGYPAPSLLSGRGIAGHASVRGARLRKRIAFFGTFRRVLVARFRRSGSTTIVECQTGESRITIAFMVAWTAFLVIIALGRGLSGPRGGTLEGIQAALIPVGMIFFGWVLAAIGRGMARDEDEFLNAFIRRRLNADKP